MSLSIKAEKRELFGKNASRRFRRGGKVPAVLYGEGSESLPLVLSKKDIFKIMKSETRENTIFKILYDSKSQDVMIKELQIDPTDDELLHADLIKIAMDKVLRISVPIQLQGEPVGVKVEGGFVDFINREMEVECLPGNIPEHIEVNISALHLHQSLKVSDITPPEGIKFMNEPSTVVVLISVPHVEVAEVKPAEEEVVAEPKEPEVIKKGKAEEKEEKEEKE